MRWFLLLCLGAAFSGCAMTAAEREQDAIATYGPWCEKQGLANGTDAWRACIQRERITAQNWREQQAQVYNARRIYCSNPVVYRSAQCP